MQYFFHKNHFPLGATTLGLCTLFPQNTVPLQLCMLRGICYNVTLCYHCHSREKTTEREKEGREQVGRKMKENRITKEWQKIAERSNNIIGIKNGKGKLRQLEWYRWEDINLKKCKYYRSMFLNLFWTSSPLAIIQVPYCPLSYKI